MIIDQPTAGWWRECWGWQLTPAHHSATLPVSLQNQRPGLEARTDIGAVAPPFIM